jgi:hypothetical protein
VRARFQQALWDLRHSERGIALPMALLLTTVAMGFAAVPILASVNTSTGDSRDQSTNMALAAAEAGMSLALLRQNQTTPTEAKPCASEEGGKLVLNKAQTSGTELGWCSPVTLTSASTPAPPPGTEVTYRVKPCYPQSNCAGVTGCAETSENQVKIVSTGVATVSGRKVERRVATVACSKAETKTETKTEKTTPPNVFAGGQIVGVEWLKLNNDAQVYNGGVGTNGAIKDFSGSANVCGTVQYGTETVTPNNGSENPPSGCAAGRKFVKGTTEYPAVILPSEIATKNSNYRLTEKLDPVGSTVYERGNISWNSSNRSLTVNYDQLTLEGTEPYYLCQLILAGGSKLLMGSGKKIRIFFDEPKNCPGLNGAAQLQIANGAYVGGDSFHGPGFYFLGSETAGASKIELGGGATVSQFVVYAPKSTIVANNGVNVNGAIIGQTLELGGGASINKSGTFTPPSLEDFLPSTTTETKIETTTPKAFARKSFIQCSATAPSTSPESGC